MIHDISGGWVERKRDEGAEKRENVWLPLFVCVVHSDFKLRKQ